MARPTTPTADAPRSIARDVGAAAELEDEAEALDAPDAAEPEAAEPEAELPVVVAPLEPLLPFDADAPAEPEEPEPPVGEPAATMLVVPFTRPCVLTTDTIVPVPLA